MLVARPAVEQNRVLRTRQASPLAQGGPYDSRSVNSFRPKGPPLSDKHRQTTLYGNNRNHQRTRHHRVGSTVWRSPGTVKWRTANTPSVFKALERPDPWERVHLMRNEPADISLHNGGSQSGRTSFRLGLRRLLAWRAYRRGMGRLHPAAAHSAVSRYNRS
jgi:hypothetical protein